MTAADLQTALRNEANVISRVAGASNIRFSLRFKDGKEKTYKLNPDGTWKVKPTTTSYGLVRFEWLDTAHTPKADDGVTVTYVDKAYTETIDPAEVIGWEFNYDLETTSTRDIPSDQNE